MQTENSENLSKWKWFWDAQKRYPNCYISMCKIVSNNHNRVNERVKDSRRAPTNSLIDVIRCSKCIFRMKCVLCACQQLCVWMMVLIEIINKRDQQHLCHAVLNTSQSVDFRTITTSTINFWLFSVYTVNLGACLSWFICWICSPSHFAQQQRKKKLNKK